MPAQNVRFGLFRLDLKTGELFHNGSKVLLQEQPFQILKMLLEHPGEVVSREEIRRTLWSDDTIVEFDNSVHAAIKKLRMALGDSAENPTYIETLPRKGYRFIFPLEAPGSGRNNNSSVLAEESAPESRGDAQNNERESTPASPTLSPDAHGIAAIGSGGQVSPVRSYSRWIGLLVFVSIIASFSTVWLRSPLSAPSISGITQLTSDRRPKGQTLLTDGTRIYFSEHVSDRWTPVSVSTNGGEVVPISMTLPSAEVLDVSPQGSDLLVNGRGALWALPTVGGTARRLGNLEAEEATWSPDGERLIYIKGNDLYLAKSDGTEPRKLTSLPASPFFLRWAPDGKRLTVSLTSYPEAGHNSLWELAADGSNLHPRFPDWNDPPPIHDCSGRWTADGKYFLFDSYRGGSDSVWVVREKGGLFEKWNREPVRLTSGPMDTGKPLPNSDGKSVFFLGSDGLNGQLSRYDSKSRQWTSYLSGIPGDQVDFSRDGEWITYVSSFPEAKLIRRKVDGSQQLQLTYPPVKTSQPRWSPDGRMIAFVAQHPGKPWKICLVSADGGSVRQLLNGDLDEGNPGWSPDGHSLVFQSDEIRILDLRTNQVRPIPDSKNCGFPRWSHDGRYLAATADSYKKVALFDFKLQKWVELTKGGDFYYPCWSRDEQYVYFIDWSTSAYCRVGIRDHKLDRVADLASVGIQYGAGGTWVGLGPDDSPLAVLVLQEIYALNWDAP